MQTIKRAAIIGAGPSGIVSAKYLLDENFLDSLDVYEQQDQVGGVWIHTPPNPCEIPKAPQTDPCQPLQVPIWIHDGAKSEVPVFMTPMYDNLETNIPQELMKYSDLEFPHHCQLFPTRQDVLSYLHEHAKDIRHFVRLSTQVTALQLLKGAQDSWRLTSKNLITGEESTKTYDAVAICSGHYNVPHIPDITGISAWDRAKRIMHSKFYRSPATFRGLKVLVVGNAASGMDIANQISESAQQPVLISQRRDSLFSPPSGSSGNPLLKILPQIAEFSEDGSRSVRFIDGHIESGIDVVLIATGYFFNFPFVHSPELGLIDNGTRVKHTYQHLFHIEHPSLALPGLCLKVIPFPLSEAQAACVARVWSGRLQLPSIDDMYKWEADTLETNGDERAFHTLLFPKDFEYQHELVNWACEVPGKQPPRFSDKAAWARARFPEIKTAFANRGKERHLIRTLEELGYDYCTWQRDNGFIEEE